MTNPTKTTKFSYYRADAEYVVVKCLLVNDEIVDECDYTVRANEADAFAFCRAKNAYVGSTPTQYPEAE